MPRQPRIEYEGALYHVMAWGSARGYLLCPRGQVFSVAKFKWLDGFWAMPRQPRIKYEGALYHVMARGDQREDIFFDDKDRTMFLQTLAEACARTGWRCHAYVLMSNHYHLVIATPKANLVVGMSWLESRTAGMVKWKLERDRKLSKVIKTIERAMES